MNKKTAKKGSSTIKTLEELAGRLKDNLDELKKPLVIEFSGTPKSGKTTCVEAISKFLRRFDIPVFVVTERASVCPIRDKTHLNFNIWTGATSLTQMLESLENRKGVVILDRGIFDSLVWLEFLHQRDSISDDELSITESFFLMERWRKQIDIVVSIKTTPEIAMRREFQGQITSRTGSIMNEESLLTYNKSLDKVISKHKNMFKDILEIDTTSLETLAGVTIIAEKVLRKADELLDAKIAVIDRSVVYLAFEPHRLLNNDNKIRIFMDTIFKQLRFVKRSEAEKDSSLVQIIPAAAMLYGSEILVTQVRSTKQDRMTDKRTIWVGGHAIAGDFRDNDKNLDLLLKRCLIREIEEEIKLQAKPANISKMPKSIIWDDSNRRSIQHVAFIYEYNIPLTRPRATLDMREHWETKNKSIFTYFKDLSETLEQEENMEKWSCMYLNANYKMHFIIDTDRQPTLL